MSEKATLLDKEQPIADMGSIATTNEPQNARISKTPSKLQYYLYFIYASIFYTLVTFFNMSISPIEDVLQYELHATSSSIGILSSSYGFTYALFQIPYGILLQHFSPQKLLLTVGVCITICFLLFGFINSLSFAITIRAFCGLFASPTWLIVITIIGKHFGNNKIALLSGIASLCITSTFLIALTFQGFVYEKYHIWRITYFGLTLIAVITLCSLMMTMYNQRQQISAKPIFHPNTACTETLNTPINENSVDDESKGKGKNKLKIVMSNYLNWCLGLYGFASFTVFSSVFGLWLIPFLMIKLNYSRSLSSFIAGYATVSSGIASVGYGYFSKKFKNRRIYLMFAVLMLSTLLFLVYLDAQMLNKYAVFIIITLSSCGVATNVILFTLAREYNEKQHCAETATGFVSAIQSSAGFVCQYVIGLLIDHHWDMRAEHQMHLVRQYDASDYQWAFSCVIPACLVMLIVTTLCLKETHAQNI